MKVFLHRMLKSGSLEGFFGWLERSLKGCSGLVTLLVQVFNSIGGWLPTVCYENRVLVCLKTGKFGLNKHSAKLYCLLHQGLQHYHRYGPFSESGGNISASQNISCQRKISLGGKLFTQGISKAHCGEMGS